MNPTTIVNLEKEGTTPRDLIKMFEDSDLPEIRVIRKDISTERVVCEINPDPLNYNLITTDGKMTVDRDNIVRYLIDCKIIYVGTIPFMFDGCVYRRIDSDAVARVIYKAIDKYPYPRPFPTVNMIKDIQAKLRAVSTPLDMDRPSLEWDPDGWYNEDELIPFDNGLYNYVHDEFLHFSPLVFLTHQLAAIYDPKITEHPVEEIYKKILPNDGTRKFFFEMVGYSLFSNKMFPPAIFVIYGPGNTGKTALQKAVTALAGECNISSLSITQITETFMTVKLMDKLINICGETGTGNTNSKDKVDGELLKRLSDGQPITVREIFGRPFEISNCAKLWFITNTMPDFGDTSSGLYRRIYVIPCREEQDKASKIWDKIVEPQALSWLANKALEGYRDFLDNNSQFHTSPEMQTEIRSYKKQEAFMDFLEERFDSTDKNVIPAQLDGYMVGDLYNDYKDFCYNGGGRPLSIRKFSEKIRNEYNLNTVKIHTYQEDGKPTYRMRFEIPPKRK